MMKTNIRKYLVLACCAVLLVCMSVGATLAYLTSTDSVENTFTVGKVAIKLDEAKANLDGTLVAGADRVKANEYKLMPGHTYAKDPTVTVLANSEASYIRVLVTINKKAALDDIGVTPYDVFNGEDLTKWVPVGNGVPGTEADTMVYEFRYYQTVNTLKTETAAAADKTLEALFTSMTIPGAITNAQLNTLEGLKINIVAQAIQADGFTTADAAWAAWN